MFPRIMDIKRDSYFRNDSFNAITTLVLEVYDDKGDIINLKKKEIASKMWVTRKELTYIIVNFLVRSTILFLFLDYEKILCVINKQIRK